MMFNNYYVKHFEDTVTEVVFIGYDEAPNIIACVEIRSKVASKRIDFEEFLEWALSEAATPSQFLDKVQKGLVRMNFTVLYDKRPR